MVTKRTQELAAKDQAHLIHPLSVIGRKPGLIFERGDGIYVWDTDGKKYANFASVGVCMHLGFGQEKIIEAAYEQMKQLTCFPIVCSTGNIPAIEYAAELAEVLPGDINHVYFTLCGTESNEVAIQIARLYWQVRGKEGKYKIICLTCGWHGTSVLTQSISGFGQASVGREHPGVLRIPNYDCSECCFGLKYPVCDILCARFLERVIKEANNEDTIAAFIGEPVQGHAGGIWPPDEYWPIVRRILTDHNILMIADEVQTGFCRTGKFWGMDQWNVVPDLLAMGKGINNCYLPLGAVGVSDTLYRDLVGHEYRGVVTLDGNPVAVATGRAALKIYIEEKMADRAAKLGHHLHDRLVNEFLTLPCVDDVMGRGLYQSFRVALNKTTGSKFNIEATRRARDFMAQECLKKGLLVPAANGSVMRQSIVPPLIICEDELDKGLDIMLDAAKQFKPL